MMLNKEDFIVEFV